MVGNAVPVNKERHRDVKVRSIDNYAFAAEINLVALMVTEFPLASGQYPIVFIEQPNGDDFVAVALLGFKPGQNLFIDEQGQWTAGYIPAMLRRHPFALARTNQDDQFAVCIEEDSALCGDTGQPLFKENGEPDEVLERAKRFLTELQQLEGATATFCRKLKEENLLVPLNMRIRDSGISRNVTGCYVINEDRLKSLSDESFLELRRSHALLPIYCHLVSLAQIDRLAREQDRRLAAAAVETPNAAD